MPTLIERFWSKVGAPTEAGCREWQASKGKHGYGQFNIKGEPRPTHRVAFFLTYGRWPEPCALHRCDNRACCEPSHLFEGSKADNTRDMVEKGRARGAPQKLSAQDVADIRANAALCRVTQKALAQRWGVNPATISRLVRNERRVS